MCTGPSRHPAHLPGSPCLRDSFFFLALKMMAVDAINCWDQKIGADRASVTKCSCGIFTFLNKFLFGSIGE